MAYSIVIKNGTIIDGTGSAPYRADVGISGERIKDIGDISKGMTNTIIDATNLYVTPGFIDITNHSDTYGTLFSSPLQESLLFQGVTTILLGNCGESLAPIVKKESLEGLERWVSARPFHVNWNSVEEFYDVLDNVKIGTNVATLIGHSTLKRNTKAKEEMLLLLTRAMDEGAWGLSSNFSFVEWTKQLEEETLSLLETVKAYSGLYKIHLRDEGRNLLPAISSILVLARKSGVRTVVSHLKAIGKRSWRDFSRALKMIHTAHEDGVDISFDTFPYLRTGSMLLSLLPEWAREGSHEEVLQRLRDKEYSLNIIQDLKRSTLHPDRILIASALQEKSIMGKTLKEISERMSLDPEVAIVEMLKINNLGVTIFGKTIHEKNLLSAFQEVNTIIASDGAGYNLAFHESKDLVHPRSFGAYPRFFRTVAPKAGISLEHSIARMTSLPARALGVSDRGVLHTGCIADIAIFHPDEFKDNATYLNPFRFASGMRHLIVDGNLVISSGELEKENGFGSVLRKQMNQ